MSEGKKHSSAGSTLKIHAIDTVKPREMLGMKRKLQGRKKPISELVSGNDLHRKSGQWNHLTREIDRENNRYRKTITNPDTGEVILKVDEPLTAHTGRGTKPKIEKAG